MSVMGKYNIKTVNNDIRELTFKKKKKNVFPKCQITFFEKFQLVGKKSISHLGSTAHYKRTIDCCHTM